MMMTNAVMGLLALEPEGMDTSGGGGGAGAAIGGIIYLAVVGLIVASMWKVFVKAGHPGWAAIVPVYNLFILVQIAGKPTWWLVLFFIPIANFIALVLIGIGVAQAFGKSSGFGLGLAFLAPIFYPMLAFSDAQYQGAPA